MPSRTFEIKVTFQYKVYTFKVEHTPVDKVHEKFIVTGYGRTYEIHSNRPNLIFRPGLKRWAPTYKIVSGTFWKISFRDLLFESLHTYVKENL